MASAERQSLEKSLRAALQALALPGEGALRRQPDDAVKADELALDFDTHHRAFVSNFRSELSAGQIQALRKIDGLLDEMSGEQNSMLWTDEAVRSHECWQAVRAGARHALEKMKWPMPAE